MVPKPWSGKRQSIRSSGLELLASGVWSGVGILGPEAFDPVPFLDLLKDDYDSPWKMEER